MRRRRDIPAPRLPTELHELTLAGRALEEQRFEDARVSAADLSSTTVRGAEFSGCLFRRVSLGSSTLERLSFENCSFDRCDLANTRLRACRLDRVAFSACRLVGATFLDSRLNDVLFDDCRLALAGLRFLERPVARFEGCDLTGADFYGSDLREVSFSDSILRDAELATARLTGVDLRGNEIEAIRGLESLRGAVIDGVQLLSLAGRLAQAIGITVEER